MVLDNAASEKSEEDKLSADAELDKLLALFVHHIKNGTVTKDEAEFFGVDLDHLRFQEAGPLDKEVKVANLVEFLLNFGLRQAYTEVREQDFIIVALPCCCTSSWRISAFAPGVTFFNVVGVVLAGTVIPLHRP
jgi:hypothetical protein